MRRKPSSSSSVLLFFLLLQLCPSLSSSVDAASSDACDPGSLPDPLTLRADQLTVLISGYSERRLPLLRSLASAYSSHPSVAAVLVLWGNPSTRSAVLARALPSGGGGGAAPITVLRDPTPSLNARFLPRAAIRTRAVAVCDDDVEVDPRSLSLAFAVWRSRERSLVGFFARSHDFDLAGRAWIYTVHPARYSIVLTKFMILGAEYLRSYTCGGGGGLAAARGVVERARNCEDILMNFVAALEGGVGPVLVEGRRVRDWGDPRNSGNGSSDVAAWSEAEGEIRRAGLSSRGDHWKRRGECIREFHRVLGRMPLRYSYGKVVEGVGEQALCRKGGKLVFCDQQDF